MRFFKRKLAIVLALLLVLPIIPARAEETGMMTGALAELDIAHEDTAAGTDVAGLEKTVSGNDAAANVPLTEQPKDWYTENGTDAAAEAETSAEAGMQPGVEGESTAADAVFFNTGNRVWKIGIATVSGNDAADGYFEADGSYTINIPEENPFFPYEVQFTHRGEIMNRWFMSPDDSVEVGGHIFYVSAHFDNTVVTQMKLNVAGDTVVVYPEKKEFTTDGDGAEALSLLPLEVRNLRADLTAYTPAELTMVSVDSLFMGSNALTDTDKLVWSYRYNDDFFINESGDKLNLSYGTANGSMIYQMIVGEADQLNADNVRYMVSLDLRKSANWLLPSVYVQDQDGKRRELSVVESFNGNYQDNYYISYYGNYYSRMADRCLYVNVPLSEAAEIGEFYVGLKVNPDFSGGTGFDHFKVYEGKYDTGQEAASGRDITAQLFCKDMTQLNEGYVVSRYSANWVTMVAYDAVGNVTGCLPFYVHMSVVYNEVYFKLFQRTANVRNDVSSSVHKADRDGGYVEETMTLYKGYAANTPYYLTMSYYENNSENTPAITAVYKGLYRSIAEAKAAGAEDVKDTLCSSDYNKGGYVADYSQGVCFTAFIGDDGTAGQEIYRYCIKTEEGTKEKPDSYLGGGTSVQFNGLNTSDGTPMDCYVVDEKEDSYGEYNYLTILVGPDADLTDLAPCFTTSSGAKLYVADSSSPEISGKSAHDFSKGPIQYTAAAENGVDSKNYWLQIVKAADGVGRLYMNSLADPASDTRTENGAVASVREVLLDGYHGYVHDIWLANMGRDAIADLSVGLESDVVELDAYWTLNGKHELSGFSTLQRTEAYGELPNLAKIRIRAKEGAKSGASVSGTLTIKSGNTPLVVLTLTGTVGDPCIVTEEIPEAVKYVPYGTMIQNNNKYSWNKVSYRLVSGKNTLPKGMTVKQNGEIYGVPTETGKFTFTVELNNSNSSFSSCQMTYTLIISENTDENVDNSTDIGYELRERVQDVRQDVLSGNQTLVSQGEYAEFVDIYLDGVKLIAGQDYTSESGSTRITILNQTLAQGEVGTHTLGIEFRTQDTDILKRSAQNYQIGSNSDNGDSDTGDSDTSGDGNNANAGSGGNGGGIENTNYSSINHPAMEVVFVTYTVLPGDSLWRIAARFYGRGELWRKIYEDNAASIRDPGRIRAGQQLRIYLTEERTSTSNAGTAGTSNAVGSVVTDGMGRKIYRVAPGDNLWTISRKVYGTGGLWGRIYQANRTMVIDPRWLYRGQVLVIPER